MVTHVMACGLHMVRRPTACNHHITAYLEYVLRLDRILLVTTLAGKLKRQILCDKSDLPAQSRVLFSEIIVFSTGQSDFYMHTVVGK